MTTSCLDLILAPSALEVVFQPVVRRQGEGYVLDSVEGLVRGPKGSTMESADVMFDYVRRKREEVAVDRACVAAVCREARQLPQDLSFALNVHAATLARDPEFLAYLVDTAESSWIAPERLTVEIVEHAPHWVGSALAEALRGLRQVGIKVAVDDIGLGQSNFKMLVDCRPDCFKIDGYFVRGAHRDPYRGAVLDAVARLGATFGARVIAEGIEAADDLRAVTAAGIELYQGFLFSRPARWSQALRETASAPPPLLPAALSLSTQA